MTRTDDSPRLRRRHIALAIAAIILLILTGVGVYGIIIGPANPERTAPDPGPLITEAPTPSGNPAEIEIPGITASTDPEVFARSAAEALFTWDTASGMRPLDYTATLLEFADPSGSEQAGLASDIAGYLPTREAWVELRKYSTRQHLSIEKAYVPEQWDEALEQARPGQLPEGATAITIEGTRHRDGIWNEEPVASEHSVAFTLFLTCPPATSPAEATATGSPSADGQEASCFLMRLSALDTPLR
ncbi:hypothetical protein [Brevibacterium sp. XM4083]|uniref:hypothetical protein n=1 Tax=Brevibacterium sp. XM4083 TaxID=2583238 RepID=UPI00112B3581|nr:hypothetical protein [Brevibacterium sp. XM4083]MCM1011786.1 hypothetical protein [Brevibacterium sp. XM4083]